MRSSKLAHAIEEKWKWCFQKMVAPVFRRTATLLLRWSAVNPDPSENSEVWKQKALDDFSAWLAALPTIESEGEPGPQACDLYSMLLEFTALRQEIKLQNRQQRTTLRTQEDLFGRFHTIVAQLDERVASLDRIHDQNWRQSVEEAAVIPFLDLRDALVRGLTAARAVAGTRSFWRRSPNSIDAVVAGYEMALRRFDRSLDRLGIRVIETIGRPFDATRMRAVDKRKVANQKPGIVLDVTLGGFIRAGRVLRIAEVVVNGE